MQLSTWCRWAHSLIASSNNCRQIHRLRWLCITLVYLSMWCVSPRATTLASSWPLRHPARGGHRIIRLRLYSEVCWHVAMVGDSGGTYYWHHVGLRGGHVVYRSVINIYSSAWLVTLINICVVQVHECKWNQPLTLCKNIACSQGVNMFTAHKMKIDIRERSYPLYKPDTTLIPFQNIWQSPMSNLFHGVHIIWRRCDNRKLRLLRFYAIAQRNEEIIGNCC